MNSLLQPKALLEKRDNVYFLFGEFSFSTVPYLWEQSQEALTNQEATVVFDLKKITQSDSSGVALLIAWTRSFRRQSRTIYFIHLPKQMLAIIQLAGLENILPIRT